jgi:hypothetical protein
MLPSTVNSPLNGRSSQSANIVQDSDYSLMVAKIPLGVVGLAKYVGKYLKSGESAVAKTASADSADISGGVDVAASDSGEVSEGLTTAVDSNAEGDLAGTLGKGLGVIGFGLSVYPTVNTCMTGTIAQCVGASVGSAAALSCMAVTDGVGSVACGVTGAAMSYLISNYGPDLINGLAQGNTAVSAITECLTITAGIGSIGCALIGAHFAPEIAAAFTTAGDAIASAFETAGGAIATGFDELGTAISSGFDSAVSSFEQAGYTALQMADV